MSRLLAALADEGRRITRSDAALAVVFAAIGLFDTLTTQDYQGPRAQLVAAMLLQTLPLSLRRSHTVLAVGLSMVGVLIEVGGRPPYGGIYGLLTLLVLVHAVARWTSGRTRMTAVALLGVGITVRTLADLAGDTSSGPLGVLGSLLITLALASVAWALGHVSRSSEEREAAVEADREAAVLRERQRISRDLHDVVGHALAGIALTAGGAERQVAGRDPEVAQALGLIRTMSGDAAADVRRLVGLMRRDGEVEPVPERDPQPSIESVPQLVARAREAGLEVSLEVTGTERHAPRGLQLAAYRVVQEGLTNALRHSPGAPVDVAVDWRPRELAVAVENARATEPAARLDEPSSGLGLVGLRERVELYDGRLTAGPAGEDGWRLEGRFPL